MAIKMVDLVIKHCFIKVNKSFVHVAQYGQSSNKENFLRNIRSPQAESNADCKKRSQNLVIFIPGNPGTLGVYHDFLRSLTKQLNDDATILAIGHNNFDHPDHVGHQEDERIFIDQEKEFNFAERTLAEEYSHDPHHIELQVLNKIIVLRRVLLDNPLEKGKIKITFVGHSIGCYVILRLLQDKQLANLHSRSILIHPALENLALTEKGQYFDRVFNLGLDIPMKLVAFLLDTLLPHSLKMFLTRQFGCSDEFAENSSKEVLESMMQLACSKHLNALISMAKSELALVRQLDCELMIGAHVPKLSLLYAKQDHWVNGSHRETLRRLYGDKIHIEERDTMHAFVMDPKAVAEYAVIVASYVNQVQE